MGSLTSANVVIMLTIPRVFNQPQQLQQFTVDDVADVDSLTVAQTEMGVDGILSAGFVYEAVKYTYSIQANSPSCFVFDQWQAAQYATQDVFEANGLMILKSIGTKWNWTRGFLTDWKPAPDIKKTLKERKFGITWQSVSPQPV
jgi:hypothetical protein